MTSECLSLTVCKCVIDVCTSYSYVFNSLWGRGVPGSGDLLYLSTRLWVVSPLSVTDWSHRILCHLFWIGHHRFSIRTFFVL